MKKTNYLVYSRAEASVTLGFTTLTIRGRKGIFSDARYEVLVENRSSGEKTVKADGSFIEAMAALRRNPKAWQAAGKGLEEVAEAISDARRDVRRCFGRDELIALAILGSKIAMDDLPKRSRLERAKISEALRSLQGKGLADIDAYSDASLTQLGEMVRRHLEDDPVFSRIASMLDTAKA